MSKAAEVKELLRAARRQGFTVTIAGNGHLRVVAPPGVSGPRGSVTLISGTPHSDKGVTNARARLKQIGFKTTDPPKPRSPRQRRATTGRPGTQEGMRRMVKLGDAARITGGSLPRPGDGGGDERLHLPVNKISDNLALAALLVWERIIEDADAQPVVRERELGGVRGVEWEGSRQGMISRIWRDLAPPDYHQQPTWMPVERRLVSDYLSRSRNMAPLRSGNRTTKTLWWVSREFIEVDPHLLQSRPRYNENWWERRVTGEEAGETRVPEPVTVTYVTSTVDDEEEPVVGPGPTSPPATTSAPPPPRQVTPALVSCPDCAYVTAMGAHSLQIHRNKLATKPHPTGRYPCPIRGCPEVRPNGASLGSHVTRNHAELKLFTCHACGAVFVSKQQLVTHQVDEHPLARAKRAPAEDVPPRTRASLTRLVTPSPLPPPPSPGTPQPAPPSTPPPSVAAVDAAAAATDPLAYLRDLVDEVTQLRDQVAGQEGLEARLRELERDNVTLRERDDAIARWLQAYPFLGGAPGDAVAVTPRRTDRVPVAQLDLTNSVQFNVKLLTELRHRLDGCAVKTGISRQALVNEAIAFYLDHVIEGT